MDQQQQSQCFQQLKTTLRQQIDHVSSFNDYLLSIKQAVAKNQTEELELLLSQNPSRIEAIEKLQVQQGELIRRYGFQHTEQGIAQLIQRCDQQQQLAQLQQDLTDKLQELEKSLLINNLLINKNQERVRQSIRILSGHHASAPGSETYSRQGISTSSEDDKNSLALA